MKRSFLFDCYLLLCPLGNSVSKKFTVVKESLCYEFRVEVPQGSNWNKFYLLCTVRGVTNKSIFMIVKFGSWYTSTKNIVYLFLHHIYNFCWSCDLYFRSIFSFDLEKNHRIDKKISFYIQIFSSYHWSFFCSFFHYVFSFCSLFHPHWIISFYSLFTCLAG